MLGPSFRPPTPSISANRIFRLAFGTFLSLPDPMAFGGDSDHVVSRWRAEPEGAVATELDGELVGSNFASRWGSVGFFGPLSVRPELWDKGVARRLLQRTMDLFAEWGTRQLGLFTRRMGSRGVLIVKPHRAPSSVLMSARIAFVWSVSI
jgi:GNAT superfamily N-acetyltransferase